jgi:hypothetical protein
MDLIFIDGGHNYSCVKNDSKKSFRMIKNKRYIFGMITMFLKDLVEILLNIFMKSLKLKKYFI